MGHLLVKHTVLIHHCHCLTPAVPRSLCKEHHDLPYRCSAGQDHITHHKSDPQQLYVLLYSPLAGTGTPKNPSVGAPACHCFCCLVPAPALREAGSPHSAPRVPWAGRGDWEQRYRTSPSSHLDGRNHRRNSSDCSSLEGE